MGHVVATAGNRVEVVAADTPQHFWKTMLDLFRFARGDAANAFDEINISAGCIERREVCGCIAEPELLTIRKHRLYCLDVMHHVAVTDGARAATIVARHAAQRRLRACGHIHGIPASMP